MATQLYLHYCLQQYDPSEPIEVDYTLRGEFHNLKFCFECLIDIEVRYCDGVSIRTGKSEPCNHLTTPIPSTTQIDFMGNRTVSGSHAIKLMRTEVREHFRSDRVSTSPGPREETMAHLEEFEELFEFESYPEIVYQHADSCIHGSHPTAIIQGAQNIFESIYHKRCNGQFVNAVGQTLDNGATGVGLTMELIRAYELLEKEENARILEKEANPPGGLRRYNLAMSSWQARMGQYSM